MKTKRTKGFWKWQKFGDNLNPVNILYPNYKLIAAAPDLLAVSIKCLEWCNGCQDLDFVNKLRAQAEEAINKATL